MSESLKFLFSPVGQSSREVEPPLPAPGLWSIHPESLFSICLLCLQKQTLEWATSIFLIKISPAIYGEENEMNEYFTSSAVGIFFPFQLSEVSMWSRMWFFLSCFCLAHSTCKTCSCSMSSFQNFKLIHKLKNNQYQMRNKLKWVKHL